MNSVVRTGTDSPVETSAKTRQNLEQAYLYVVFFQSLCSVQGERVAGLRLFASAVLQYCGPVDPEAARGRGLEPSAARQEETAMHDPLIENAGESTSLQACSCVRKRSNAWSMGLRVLTTFLRTSR